jgi:hypothetical protein
MARFVMLLVGRRIYLPTEDNQDSIVGFVTARLQSARDEEHACQLSRRDIFAEWNDFYNRDNRSGVPELSVGYVKRLRNPLFMRSIDNGYSFFSNDAEGEAFQQKRTSFTQSRWCF